ncbi:MAG: hypothetical protein WC599_11675 [Bacteroidales bacterium]
MQQTGKIIIAVVVTAVVVGGVVYFWQQKNNVAQNVPSTLESKQKPTTQKQPSQSAKTSTELMKELIAKNYPTATVENYKIFEEIKSPNSTKSAILFGLDIEKTKECCSKPIGIFINNQGSLGTKYDILQGALQQMYLENAKWQDDKTVLYDFVISDEGGKKTTQKSLMVD